MEGFWKGKKLPEEVKKKISETLKRKGIKPKKPFYAIEENHPKWKNGVGTYRKMLLRRGFKLDRCSDCGGRKRIMVHHVDGDRENNDVENLQVMCVKCHNNLHDAGIRTRFKKGHKLSKKARMKISKANIKHGGYSKYIG